MQPRVYIVAFVILALAAAVTVPRANAEPLTIMAIAGLVTVLSVSSVDMALNSDDNSNKDMRAQQEETAPMRAGAEADTQAFIAASPAVAAPSAAAP
jgi:hypothetical protein